MGAPEGRGRHAADDLGDLDPAGADYLDGDGHRDGDEAGHPDGNGNGHSDGHEGAARVVWTRTAGEFVGGCARVGLFFAGVGFVLLGLARFVVNGVRSHFDYVRLIPYIGWVVPIGGAVALGCVAVAVYGVFMRPRRSIDRVSSRNGTTTVGGHWWGEPAPVRGDGGSGGSGPGALT